MTEQQPPADRAAVVLRDAPAGLEDGSPVTVDHDIDGMPSEGTVRGPVTYLEDGSAAFEFVPDA